MENGTPLWDIQNLRDDNEQELNNEELYSVHFKKFCFLCSAPIPGNWQYYKILGNCCSPCTSRIDMVSKNHITKEQAIEMLVNRKEQVIKGEICEQYDYVKRKMVKGL